jgi:DNA-binding transcriptional LysR family regulator
VPDAVYRSERGVSVVDLRSIEAFLAVTETGSFTAAAKRLNKTQSAVSQAIRQLEDDLGVVLINRGSRALSLTPPGELLRGRAALLFDDAVALASRVREYGQAKLAELRFGMVESFATAVGPALLRSMLYEAVNLSLWSDITPRLTAALSDRRFDVVVANDAFTEDARLTRIALIREPYVLLLPRGAGWDVATDDLRTLARSRPMIRYHAPSYLASQIDAQLQRMNVQLSRRVSVDTSDKLLAMVAAGIGWSIGTPLSLLRSRSLVDVIRVTPFPGGQPFHRELVMLSRLGEFDDLTRRLASTAREVLAGPIMDDVGALLPGLRHDITIPEPHFPA